MSTRTVAPTSPRRAPRRTDLRRRAWLVVMTFLALGVVAYAVLIYGGLDPSTSRVDIRPEVPLHYPVLIAHITTGAIALALGPLQFVRRIRAHARVHRWIGRTYLFAGVFPSALVGIPTALLGITGGPWAAGGLLVGDLAWGATAVIAYRAVRQRRYRDHARWMTRNYALTFAAVTFRIWLALLILAQLPILESVHGGDFDRLFQVAYATTAWLAFLPNAAFVALLQRRMATSRSHARAAVA